MFDRLISLKIVTLNEKHFNSLYIYGTMLTFLLKKKVE